MNKEEILEKSRKENIMNDERNQLVEYKGANFSIPVLIIVWLIMDNFLPIGDQAQYAVGFLTHITCLANFGYQFTQNRTKMNLFLTVMFTLLTCLYLYLLVELVYF